MSAIEIDPESELKFVLSHNEATPRCILTLRHPGNTTDSLAFKVISVLAEPFSNRWMSYIGSYPPSSTFPCRSRPRSLVGISYDPIKGCFLQKVPNRFPFSWWTRTSKLFSSHTSVLGSRVLITPRTNSLFNLVL